MQDKLNYDYYVYLHRTIAGEVFYIGKGNRRRAWSKSNRSLFWRSVVEKHGFTVELIATGIQEWYAHELEVELIDMYGRRDIMNGTLVNMTDGGEGISGAKRSKQSKVKVGNSLRGKSKSESHKQAMRIARAKVPLEIKQVGGKKNKGRFVSEEWRLKSSNSHKASPLTSAHMQRLAIKLKKTVRCSNGMKFDSSKEAVEWLRTIGVIKAARTNIARCSRGDLKSAYGFKWCYCDL